MPALPAMPQVPAAPPRPTELTVKLDMGREEADVVAQEMDEEEDIRLVTLAVVVIDREIGKGITGSRRRGRRKKGDILMRRGFRGRGRRRRIGWIGFMIGIQGRVGINT